VQKLKPEDTKFTRFYYITHYTNTRLVTHTASVSLEFHILGNTAKYTYLKTFHKLTITSVEQS